MELDSDDEYLDFSDEEDIICSSRYVLSSDEDDDTFLTKLNRATKTTSKQKGTKYEDDFEKEMASELSATMNSLTSSFAKRKQEENKPGPSQGASKKKPQVEENTEEDSEFYDDIYFDSDDSDGEDASAPPGTVPRPKNKREKRRILSNDELFYDPNMDERDQQWMDAKRRSYQVKRSRENTDIGTNDQQPLPESDAVLNCPACLTTLCMDCQRHAIYKNQYRAMFVFNCTIDNSEALKYPTKQQKKKEFLKNKKKNKNRETGDNTDSIDPTAGQTENSSEDQPSSQQEGTVDTKDVGQSDGQASSSTSSSLRLSEGAEGAGENNGNEKRNKSKKVSFAADEEYFHPVMCSICNTKVAVIDKDEVYHFFNVVTSY